LHWYGFANPFWTAIESAQGYRIASPILVNPIQLSLWYGTIEHVGLAKLPGG
jgi:hypothetical protein